LPITRRFLFHSPLQVVDTVQLSSVAKILLPCHPTNKLAENKPPQPHPASKQKAQKACATAASINIVCFYRPSI
jgi:hypothetical protein